MQRLFIFASFALALIATACVQPPPQQGTTNNATTGNTAQTSKDPNRKIKIGFAMDTVKEERWQRDQEAFRKRCDELKDQVECEITVANNDASRQANDVDNLLTKGIDVLVIAPHDATQAASMVDKAKAQGIPVVSYDRLINSDKIDLYISHQVPVIGRKIAEYAVEKVPEGDYVMVYGANTDNNSHIMKKEQLAVIDAAKAAGKKINIVEEQHINDWSRELALNFAENALTKHNDKIAAFIVSNDGMASGVLSALAKRGLAGKILVTGQDAEKSALQSIAEGKQTMTVYKPIIPLASGAVDAAIKLAKKQPLTDAKPFMNDVLKKEVPSILLEVQTVDKDNLTTTVIKDGYAKFDEVYQNVPPDQRPKQ